MLHQYVLVSVLVQQQYAAKGGGREGVAVIWEVVDDFQRSFPRASMCRRCSWLSLALNRRIALLRRNQPRIYL